MIIQDGPWVTAAKKYGSELATTFHSGLGGHASRTAPFVSMRVFDIFARRAVGAAIFAISHKDGDEVIDALADEQGMPCTAPQATIITVLSSYAHDAYLDTWDSFTKKTT